MSFIRLSVRRNVLLPQPDGPMNAVTTFGWILMRDVFERPLGAVVEGQVIDVDLDAGPSLRAARAEAAGGLGTGNERPVHRLQPCLLSTADSGDARGRQPCGHASRSARSITSTSAPAQACRCQSSYGEIA